MSIILIGIVVLIEFHKGNLFNRRKYMKSSCLIHIYNELLPKLARKKFFREKFLKTCRMEKNCHRENIHHLQNVTKIVIMM